jgi:hypothetical protein
MKHYFEVIKEGLSICLDTDIHYHYEFKIGEIIHINMYSDEGPKLVFGTVEYYVHEFTIDWTKSPRNIRSNARLDIGSCITKGYMRDITIQVLRDKKLDLIL